MAIYDGVLNVVLRNPFEDKSKFFKNSKYVFGPRLILGTVFAFVEVPIASIGLAQQPSACIHVLASRPLTLSK